MKHEHTPPHLGLGIAIALVAYLFFITASSLVWNIRYGFPVIQIVFVQNIVSLLCILPMLYKQGFPYLRTKVYPIHLMRDLAGVLSYYLYFVAIQYLNLVDATVLNYTAPFFVPLIWWIWKQEKVQGNVWWSIIAGFIGVAIILNPTRQILQIGFLFGLFAGILSAVAFCAIRILNIHLEPARRVLFYYFATGSLLTFPFAMVYWTSPTFWQWVAMISIGVTTALGQICLTIAYRYGTASYLSPLGYSTVIYAGIISYALFDAPLSWRSIIGTLLIILGGTVTYLLKKKPHSIAQTFESPDPKTKPPL